MLKSPRNNKFIEESKLLARKFSNSSKKTEMLPLGGLYIPTTVIQKCERMFSSTVHASKLLNIPEQ